MQTVSVGDNLHKMLNLDIWEKQEKFFNMLSAENFTKQANC